MSPAKTFCKTKFGMKICEWEQRIFHKLLTFLSIVYFLVSFCRFSSSLYFLIVYRLVFTICLFVGKRKATDSQNQFQKYGDINLSAFDGVKVYTLSLIHI